MSRRLNKPDTEADISLRECLADKRSFVVVAGAGSGKTTSLIKALKFIDESEGKKLRQEGKRIACITYTTTAEKEILDDVGHDVLFHVSTIHSFLWELIRPFQPNIKAWVTQKIQLKIEENETKRSNFGNRVQQATRDKTDAEIIRYQQIASIISNVNEFSYETGSNYAEGILGHSDIISLVPDLITSSVLLQTILAEKYPYFFIDESQDTIPNFIAAMKVVDRNINNFCLGFFGDPMQKIYMTGTGPIALEQDWQQIDKPENFRCSTNVLDVVNNIRIGSDTLQQTGGRKKEVNGTLEPVEGSAHLFVLEADENRQEKIQAVRLYLANKLADELWNSDTKEADVKILVIEHRMAAKRLKFGDLFAAFNDNSTESLTSGFREGTLWAIQPFIKFIVPLYHAQKKGKHFEVMQLLRNYCPLLQRSHLENLAITARELLSDLKDSVIHLCQLLDSNTSTVKDTLEYINEKGLFEMDERISSRLEGTESSNLDESVESDIRIDSVIDRYFAVPVKQFLGYQTYIDDESPYSTQHSIKGAEFERVIVILDDEEGNTNTYSYNKLLGIVPPSDRDQENITAGNDNTLDRTRRLFYVCCSRSLLDLAVVLFVTDPEAAIESISQASIFNDEDIKVDSDLN